MMGKKCYFLILGVLEAGCSSRMKQLLFLIATERVLSVTTNLQIV